MYIDASFFLTYVAILFHMLMSNAVYKQAAFVGSSKAITLNDSVSTLFLQLFLSLSLIFSCPCAAPLLCSLICGLSLIL